MGKLLHLLEVKAVITLEENTVAPRDGEDSNEKRVRVKFLGYW